MSDQTIFAEILSIFNGVVQVEKTKISDLVNQAYAGYKAITNPCAADAKAQFDKANSILDQARNLTNDVLNPAVTKIQTLIKTLSKSYTNKPAEFNPINVNGILFVLDKDIFTNLQNQINQAKAEKETIKQKIAECPEIPTTTNKPQDPATEVKPGDPKQNSANEDKTTNATASQNQTAPVPVPGNTPNKPSTSTVPPNEPAPGKRLYNPLSRFASYTYQLTWYMITPDGYDAFINSGRRDINALRTAAAATGDTGPGGAYIIAQSGGINDTTTQRAPGLEFDYYIDNLKITTTTNNKTAGGEMFYTELSFQVIEPYGFSLITNLQKAGKALEAYSASINRKIENPLRQFFMLGVRFYGYDANGNLITGKEKLEGEEPLDPEGNSDGIFERFFDFTISDFKFKIDGRAVTYDITANSFSPQAAFGMKKGVLDQGATVQAKTVKQALLGPTGILTRLNKLQDELLQNGSITVANKYNVKFLGDAETEIAEASIVLPSDLDKWKWAGAPAVTSADSNDIASVKAVPNSNERIMVFKSGTTMLQAVNRIISQSSYLEEALKTVYTTQPPDPKKKDRLEVKPKNPNTIAWYNISADVTKAKWDPKVGDWAYEITYVIQPYLTPVLQSAYTNPGTPYYGPHKRYDYWYTGKNSEIISYSQSFDCGFFTVSLDPGQGGEQASTAQGAPTVPNKRTNSPRLGKLDVGMEAQNTYITSLNDAGSLTTFNMTIMGDPDYLISDSPTGETSIYNRFYAADGFTINANGGQVYIEIDFKEAVDYQNSTGVMKINESILFWKYPESISKKIKGVAYMLQEVKHNFAGGKFTQQLYGSIANFPDDAAAEDKSKSGQQGTSEKPSDRPGAPSAQSNPATNSGSSPGGTSTTNNQGLKPDAPVTSTGKGTVTTPTTSAPVSPNQVTKPTPTGRVADGDAQPSVTLTPTNRGNNFGSNSSFAANVANITVGNVTQKIDPPPPNTANRG